MAGDAQRSEAARRKQFLWLFVFLAVLLVISWSAFWIFGGEFWRNTTGTVSGQLPAFALVFGLMAVSERWGKRITLALLIAWAPLTILFSLLPLGFDFTDEGLVGGFFSGLVSGFLVATLIRILFWDRFPTPEEARQSRRNALQNLKLLAIIFGAIIVAVVGVYVAIEYVASPLIRLLV